MCSDPPRSNLLGPQTLMVGIKALTVINGPMIVFATSERTVLVQYLSCAQLRGNSLIFLLEVVSPTEGVAQLLLNTAKLEKREIKF